MEVSSVWGFAVQSGADQTRGWSTGIRPGKKMDNFHGECNGFDHEDEEEEKLEDLKLLLNQARFQVKPPNFEVLMDLFYS